METEATEKKKIRIVCNVKRYPVYKKTPYIIPVVQDGGRFITGQDLTPRQMIKEKTAKGQILEPEPLTEAQKEKYPLVIDPTNNYKVKHLTWLDPTVEYDKIRLELMKVSGYWAKTKEDFDENPVVYHGYFEDPIAEVVVKNNKRDEIFEAESAVRSARMDEYERIGLIFSFTVPGVDINTKVSHDILKGQLLDLCASHPKQMKRCFVKYNPGIEMDIFLLECIDAKVIQTKDKGDLWFDNEYLGTSLDDVKKFLSKSGKEHLKNKLGTLLNDKKNVSTTPKSASTGDSVGEVDYLMLCKSAIFDGKSEEAKKNFIKINKEKFPTEWETLKNAIEDMKEKQMSIKEVAKREQAIQKFKDELTLLTLEALQEKIVHPLSNYKEEDCKDVWGDKEKLIEYMISVKFGK